jgi:D-alanine-D-alanine ligase
MGSSVSIWSGRSSFSVAVDLVTRMSDQLRVGVFFGSRSVEHEVSVITAQQAMAALPADRFVPVPVYIAKSGAWYTGDQLLQLERYKDIDRLIAASTRVTMRPDPSSAGELVEVGARRGLLGGGARAVARFDVAMPLVHGSNGEDGTLQGLFELAALPYCGCDVASAALSMDKRLSRTTLRGAGIPVLDDVMVSRTRWLGDPDGVCAGLAQHPGFPMYVKPRRLGSSIGVARVERDEQLRDALEVAFGYDTSILAEQAQDGSVEVNCSVLGSGDDVRASVCEQPVSTGTLSYADKYLSGAKAKGGAKAPAGGMKSSQRIIPAPISDSLTKRIQDTAMASFRAIGAAGVTRVDFLVSPERDSFVVNELNTLPGSLSFYLWEASGLSFDVLLTRLIDMAIARHREQQATTASIDTWLLTGRPG